MANHASPSASDPGLPARGALAPPLLSFGIPSLDELLGHPPALDESFASTDFGFVLGERDKSTSLCLIGPDGTGKSVLALHLASQYAATASAATTRILYASTDLSFSKAREIWTGFVLDRPQERHTQIEKVLHRGRAIARKPPEGKKLRIELDRYHPLIPSRAAQRAAAATVSREALAAPLTEYLCGDPRIACAARDGKQICGHGEDANCQAAHGRLCHRIAFIDLESTTAGDDWGLINRLLATLERPPAADDRHLLIIDAVEGLETLGGKRDVFGQERERRSRIAQILRTAKNKCHVVFIVEEPREKERLPEEFVSDAVIRLRVERQRDYSRRTIEIEKLRGQAYIRGRHDCLIRRGNGSQTGVQDNPDDRALRMAEATVTSAYVQIIHSLHYLSREVMELPLPADGIAGGSGANSNLRGGDPRAEVMVSQSNGLAGFGIRYLDEMIGDQGFTGKLRRGETPPSPETIVGSEPLGLPWGSLTALIGDEGAYKDRIGRAFLAQAFRDADAAPTDTGVALLLTTKPMDTETLALKFLNHNRVGGAKSEQRLLVELKRDFEEFGSAKQPIAHDEIAALGIEKLQVNILSSITDLDSLPPDLKEALRVLAAQACRLDALAKEPLETLTLTQTRLRDVRAKLEWALQYFRSILASDLGEIGRANTARSARRLKRVARQLADTETKLDAMLKPYRVLNEIGALARQIVEEAEFVSRAAPAAGAKARQRGTGQRSRSGSTAARAVAGKLQSLVRSIDALVRPQDNESAGDDAIKSLESIIGRMVETADLLRRLAVIKRRTICRRLEIHHMTSAVLFNIVHSLVEEGLNKTLWRGKRPSERKRIPDSKAPGRVRLVIDDWSDILNSYPEIREDPLFLPFLAFYLKRRGITTLFVDTQPGRLNHILSHETDRELRALVPHHLYTWHVTFYGEKRVAITALPPISNEKVVVVRELKPHDGHEESLIVDPHFEYYDGFGGDSPPRPVPLRVRLYHEDKCPSDYFRDVTVLFERLYARGEEIGEPRDSIGWVPATNGPRTEDGRSEEDVLSATRGVIQLERSASYDALRDFAYLQGKSALEHTLVLQVDEFWSPDGESLHDMRSYFQATTFDQYGFTDPMEDPFRLFKATDLDPIQGQSRAITRWDCFVTIGYQLGGATPPGERGTGVETMTRLERTGSRVVERRAGQARSAQLFDRVPYSLDFGLVLAVTEHGGSSSSARKSAPRTRNESRSSRSGRHCRYRRPASPTDRSNPSRGVPSSKRV